jgi:hypothetical protein
MQLIPWRLPVRGATTALVLAFFLHAAVRAEDEAPQTPAQAEKPGAVAAADQAPKNLKPLNAKQERQTLDFARIHHPELADLLEKLKTADPPEYQRALADLRPAQQRLLRLEEREPTEFPRELALWKIESRIRLLMAQMAMEDNDESLEASLRPLLAERRELKQQSLQLERKRTADRLANLDRQLEQLQEPQETYTANEMKRLKQTLARQRKAGKGKAKLARQKARDAGKKDAKADRKSEKLEQKREQTADEKK